MPIINSLLDTDMYKCTMHRAVHDRYRDVRVKYRYKCRTRVADLRPYAEEISREIDAFCNLRLQPDESAWLKNRVPYLGDNYIADLEAFSPPRSAVKIDDTGEQLGIEIEGYWYDTILFEVPILAIVAEVYYRNAIAPEQHDAIEKEAFTRLFAKIEWLKDQDFKTLNCYRFIEFGTRRRYSANWQKRVLAALKRYLPVQLLGTSNMALARDFYLKPYGTMAHEWLQAHQALAPLPHFQRAALQVWSEIYRGDLGIALTDVVGMDAFLRDFDRYFAMLFTGGRHDSGDPREWANKFISHYEKLCIDPRSKVGMFSDSLNFESSFGLTAEFGEKMQVSHGIGTFLTCDMGLEQYLGFPALNHVLKMVECDGMPVAKISDSPGKGMCDDPDYLKALARIYRIA